MFSSSISDEAGQFLDGNGDGVGGDDDVSPVTGPGRIFRLFGDGDVDITDFVDFRTAFGTGPPIFDFDATRTLPSSSPSAPGSARRSR